MTKPIYGLRLDELGGTDYTMLGEPGCGNAVWITVGTISVHLKKGEEGVSVTLYPLGHEAEDSITETWATYEEGKLDEEAHA